MNPCMNRRTSRNDPPWRYFNEYPREIWYNGDLIVYLFLEFG